METQDQERAEVLYQLKEVFENSCATWSKDEVDLIIKMYENRTLDQRVIDSINATFELRMSCVGEEDYEIFKAQTA